MSLTELRDIAKAGKTAENDIKINDSFIFDYDNEIYAKIVAIGNDYVTCSLIAPFKAPYYYLKHTLVNKAHPTAIIGYHNSDLRKRIYQWYTDQSSEFKSVVKETVKYYKTCLLKYNYNTDKYEQHFYGFEKRTEKIFIPSITETSNLIKTEFLSKKGFQAYWTSEPSEFRKELNVPCGVYFFKRSGEVTAGDGDMSRDVVLLFNIG